MYDVRGSVAWGSSLLNSRANQDLVSRGRGTAGGTLDATLGAITLDGAPDVAFFAVAWRGASTTAPVETTATERRTLGVGRCLALVAAGRV